MWQPSKEHGTVEYVPRYEEGDGIGAVSLPLGGGTGLTDEETGLLMMLAILMNYDLFIVHYSRCKYSKTSGS